jgi:SAM-dependent methyltransferase
MKLNPKNIVIVPLLFVLGCQAPEPSPDVEQSVRPNVNSRFLDPNLNLDALKNTFEGESREISQQRDEIIRELNLKTGMAVADIGAGTGLFMSQLAQGVGTSGHVYAVDISPKFIEHIDTRIAEAGFGHVETVLCSEDSAELPEASVDLIFVCDTYHHFEYPRSTLASIHRALRPGGDLVIVDFERIPGITRPWILEHVRAGKQETTAEITAAGFFLTDEVLIPGLSENYFIRFKRQ